MEKILLLFVPFVVPTICRSETLVISKLDLLDKLSSLAGVAEDDGGACDLLILPNDNRTFSLIDEKDEYGSLNQVKDKGIILTSGLSTSLVESSKCPLIVLQTSQVERFLHAKDVTSGTRFPASLALITDAEAVIEAYMNASWRFTFDAHLLTSQGSETLEVSTITPTENEAWKTVRIVYVAGDLYIRLKPDGNHVGRDWEVLGQLAKETGISYIFEPSPNSFVGMIDEVNAGRADMAISQGSFETGRYTRAGDMSAAYDERIFSLVANKPQLMPARWTLTYVFDIWSWGWLGLSVIAMVLALKLLNAETSIYDDVKIENYRILAISVITLISEALPHEWFNFRLQSKMGMVLMFTWFLCGLFLSMAYESTLLSQLVALEYDEAIDTWQEVYDNKILLTVPTYLIMNALMKNSKREIIQKVYQENVLAKGGLYGREDKARIDQMVNEGKAMKLGTTSFLSGQKHLRMWGEPLEYTYTGSHFVKKFPWKRQQDMIINRLVAADILNKLRIDVEFNWSKAERDYERNTTIEKEKKLTLTHMWLTWIVLGVGTTLSVLGFMWEGVTWWRDGRKVEEMQVRDLQQWLKYQNRRKY